MRVSKKEIRPVIVPASNQCINAGLVMLVVWCRGLRHFPTMSAHTPGAINRKQKEIQFHITTRSCKSPFIFLCACLSLPYTSLMKQWLGWGFARLLPSAWSLPSRLLHGIVLVLASSTVLAGRPHRLATVGILNAAVRRWMNRLPSTIYEWAMTSFVIRKATWQWFMVDGILNMNSQVLKTRESK